MPLQELPGAAKPDAAPASAVSAAPKDRRRPGRSDQASPHLIPLLRTAEVEAAAAPSAADELPFDNALEPIQGIVLGLALSVPLWAAIGGIAWVVL